MVLGFVIFLSLTKQEMSSMFVAVVLLFLDNIRSYLVSSYNFKEKKQFIKEES